MHLRAGWTTPIVERLQGEPLHKRGTMQRFDPWTMFLVVAALAVAALSFVLWWTGLAGAHAYLSAASAVTLAFYGYDKRRAVAGGTRIPELILHVLALAGGSPGALLGQVLFRHKTRKVSFKIVFMLIVAVQLIAVCVYLSHVQGAL